MGNDVVCGLCGCDYREHSKHECDVQAAHAHGQDLREAEMVAWFVEWLREIPPAVIDDWGLNAVSNIAGMLEDGSWEEGWETENGGADK